MKSKITPVAASVIFALAAALIFAAVTSLLLRLNQRTTALNTALFIDLAAYVGFLGGLNKERRRDLFPSFLTLSAVLVVAGTVTNFVIPAAATLSWIRSGICSPGPTLRRMFAEAIFCPAGLVLAWVLQPPGLYGWTLSVWLFWLIQALYFLVVDPEPGRLMEHPDLKKFEAAHSRAETLLREQKLKRAFEELGL
ncbi:MAG: hypothetical protein ACM3KE_03615 [Hyphomicrobiales bacterium]